MKRPLHRLLHGTVTAVATLIILLALLSLGARLLLPRADVIREALLAHLNQRLGVEIEVGRLSVQLRGLTPTLLFSDARLLTPEEAASAPAAGPSPGSDTGLGSSRSAGSGPGSGAGSGAGEDSGSGQSSSPDPSSRPRPGRLLLSARS
ncbi:hypothetical protein [Halochromatium sp.]